MIYVDIHVGWYQTGRHHRLEDYARRGQEPKGEVQIYTWPDASLRELTDLIKEVQVEARRPATKLSFAFVYPDRKGRNVMREVCTLLMAYNSAARVSFSIGVSSLG